MDALSQAGAAAWTWRGSGSPLGLTPGTAALLGGAPGSLEELEALVHPADRLARRAAIDRALSRGEPWVCTFRGTGARAATWIEERGRAFPGAAGAEGATALLLDITARREGEQALEEHLRSESRARHAAQAATTSAEATAGALARQEAFLESIFASMADGLVLFDAAGRITRMNPAAREMLQLDERVGGVPHEQLPPGITVRDVEGRAVPPERQPLALALRGESTKGVPLALAFCDGRKLWATMGAAPIRDPGGAVAGAVVSLGDVSRLRDLQEQREDLSRMLSHDLRTPLGVILAQAKLIGRRAEALEAVRARAEAITTSAQRMAAMLNDLVESALLEAGKLRLDVAAVNLPEMVRELRRRLSGSFDGERIRVEEAGPVPRIGADPNRLERVLVNLLTNALKYSAPGTEVLVRLASEAEQVLVDVVDRGQGISPDDVPHLFERYFRGPESFRLEGMGLGLYTARMLVEAHGGTIEVSSVPGQGSTFRVRLPARAAPR